MCYWAFCCFLQYYVSHQKIITPKYFWKTFCSSPLENFPWSPLVLVSFPFNRAKAPPFWVAWTQWGQQHQEVSDNWLLLGLPPEVLQQIPLADTALVIPFSVFMQSPQVGKYSAMYWQFLFSLFSLQISSLIKSHSFLESNWWMRVQDLLSS